MCGSTLVRLSSLSFSCVCRVLCCLYSTVLYAYVIPRGRWRIDGYSQIQLQFAASGTGSIDYSGTLFTKSMNSTPPIKLRTMVVLGSTSNHSPPWGGPKRLGERVAKFLLHELKNRKNITHEIDYIDLREVKLPLLEQAHHWYAPGTAPAELEALAQRVAAADCYVLVSPEYNHSMSPALSNFLDHFGGSKYAYKPSAIAVYSSGPFGGVRAAMQLRVLTAEIGCISVSAIFTAPSAQASLDEEGKPLPPNGQLLEAQAHNVFNQLEWMADAMKKQRETVGLPK